MLFLLPLACSTPETSVPAPVPVPATPPQPSPEGEAAQPPVPETTPTSAPAPAPAPAPETTPTSAPAPAPEPAPATPPQPDPTPATPPQPDPAPPPIEPHTWTLQPRTGALYVLVRYDRGTALSNLAHDHTIAATGWQGTVRWKADDASACAVDISVPVSGLVVDPPGLRAKAGLEGDTPEDDKPKIQENMWGKKQLEKDRFPTISFVSTRCEGDPANPTVRGRLTIHGVTRDVSLPMKVDATDDRFTASGVLDLKGTTYGFDPFSAALGAVKNQDALRLVIDVTGR